MRLVLSFAILHIIVVVVVVVRISAVVLRILLIIIIIPKRRDESPHNLSHSTSTSLSSLSKTSRTRAKKKKKKSKKSTNFVRMIFEEKTRERDVLVTLEDEKSAHIIKILPNPHSSERKEEEEKRELAREDAVNMLAPGYTKLFLRIYE